MVVNVVVTGEIDRDYAVGIAKDLIENADRGSWQDDDGVELAASVVGEADATDCTETEVG